MLLTTLLAVMTAAAVFAVLWPLSVRRPALAGRDLDVYRDQLEEIARDTAGGLIDGEAADAARVEVSRRLLASAAVPVREPHSPIGRRRVVAILALVAVPVAAGGLYLHLGAPSLPGQPLAARMAAPNPRASLDSLVAQVEARLARQPDDARGWEVLAPVYLRLGRATEAAEAWRRVLALAGDSAERRANLGEALVAAHEGVVVADARAAFDRALALDPKQPKARYFKGVAAEQDGHVADALAIWRAMLTDVPPDAGWPDFVRAAIARVELASNDKVQAMVASLAERMTREGTNVAGWLRLMRSYVVLGERDRAIAAVADARRALAGDTDKLSQIDALARDLGIAE